MISDTGPAAVKLSGSESGFRISDIKAVGGFVAFFLVLLTSISVSAWRFASSESADVLVACRSMDYYFPEFTDAEVIALELSGELLAPPELVNQVAADLAAVRAYEPYFETIHVLPS